MTRDTNAIESTTPIALPHDLDSMAPGPEMAAELIRLDPTTMTHTQLGTYVGALRRHLAFWESMLRRALQELHHAPPEVDDRVVRTDRPVPFADVAAAVDGSWTAGEVRKMLHSAAFVCQEAPQVGQAMHSGQVSADAAEVMRRQLQRVTDPDVLAAVVDDVLADPTRSQTTDAVRSRTRRSLARRDPQSVRRRRARDHADRSLQARPEDETDLTALVLHHVDPVDGAAVNNVRAIAAATHAAGDPAGRTQSQLSCDVAVALMAGADLTQHGFVVPVARQGTVTLTVGLTTLAALDGEPAELAGIGPITAHIARAATAQMAATSTWRYAVTRQGRLIAEGAIPANLVGVTKEALQRHAADTTAGPDGRAHRRPTAAQVAFVRARDKTCQGPGGCTVPAERCQIDHRISWYRGGPTFIDNLHCLCARHHRAKDEGGWSYRPVTGGIEWTGPDGSTYLRRTTDDPITDPTPRPRRHRRRRGRVRRRYRPLPVIYIDLPLQAHWR